MLAMLLACAAPDRLPTPSTLEDDPASPYRVAPDRGDVTITRSDDTGDTASVTIEVDRQYDVIVVGSGPAGTAAAITARDAGADVLLIEREDEAGLGLILGGRAFAAGSPWQAIQGVSDSPEAAAAEWESITGVSGDTPGVVDFLENSAATLQWLVGYGMRVASVAAERDSGLAPRVHDLDWEATDIGTGQALLAAFDGELRTGVEVTGPILEDGAVIGVTWTDLATGLSGASGAGAVVIATGGFVRALDEVHTVAPALAGRRLAFEANPSSDGGGLPFLRAVGAGSLSPENIGLYFHAVADPWFPDGEALVAIGVENGILVGADGARFVDEDLQRSFDIFDALPNGDVFELVDEDRASGLVFMRPYYNWSNPPEEEFLTFDEVVALADDIFVGGSPEEVAALAGIDADGLASTVAEWNLTVEAGGEDVFGRDLATATVLEGESWVALRLTPGLAKNFGGVATDEIARVLDTDGTPIAGLYAAGEVAGMVLGGGGGDGFSGSVTACYWGGRVAGREASAFAGAE